MEKTIEVVYAIRIKWNLKSNSSISGSLVSEIGFNTLEKAENKIKYYKEGDKAENSRTLEGYNREYEIITMFIE